MVSEKDRTRIRRFVCGQLRDEPDLSSLTLGILKKRYLAHVRFDSLSPDARNYMKQVVQEELLKMQDSDKSGSDQETKKPQNKRKREKEDEIASESEDESKAKKARRQSSSSSESEDKSGCKSESEESEGKARIQLTSEQDVTKNQSNTNGSDKQQDSTDEESSESTNKGNQSGSEDNIKEKVKKGNAASDEETKSSKTNEENKTSRSDDDNQTDTDSKSETSSKIKDNDSSGDGKKVKVSTEKTNNESDSDSSSLPSLEDEQKGGLETKQDNKKRKREKTTKKDESTKDQKDENKTIVRLKRYIALCGVRRNYKKLLDGCRSIRSKVAVLKKELEDLGVHGNPSIDKCKKVRMKREEAQELAELDVSNIIATQGRPKRRGASTWQEEPPSSTFKRTLNSDSEQDETHRGHRRVTDWANLQGIISDDEQSD